MIKKTNINEYIKTPFLDGIELLNATNCTLDFPLHKHETYNISLITKNTFHTNLADKSFEAPAGSIAITNTNELHSTPCESDIGNSFITFYIPPTVIEQISHSNTLCFEDRVIYDKKMFNDLLHLSQKKNLFGRHFEEKIIDTLSALLNKSQISHINKKLDNSLRLFIKDIVLSEEKFSVSNTASKYGINKYKFIRLFKQETGLTPKHFMLLKRIEKSKLLLQLGHPIFEVAIDCGFYDCPHFYKYFKQYIGVNPLEYQSAFTT